MFGLTTTMQYYLCTGATDMRKSFYTLSGIVTNIMGKDIRSGNVFVFINKKRTTIKLLRAEQGGLVLYIKKLEAGIYPTPKYDEQSKSYTLTYAELVMIIEGIKAEKITNLKRLKILTW
ncbi:MAG: IS66 family insertion sequence element accessory protein TnpB [Bacteroides sp.]